MRRTTLRAWRRSRTTWRCTRRKLDRLTALYRLETKRYFFLRRQYSLALARLNARLVEVYEHGEVESTRST